MCHESNFKDDDLEDEVKDFPVICETCGEFIGYAGELDTCPLCGSSLDGNNV